MEKQLIWILIVFLALNVSASNHDAWDSFEDDSQVDGNIEIDNNQKVEDQLNEHFKSPGSKYTLEFYAAIIVGSIGILILSYLAYIMFRKPSNQFNKK